MYDVRDWYWRVSGISGQVYSGKRAGYFNEATDADYLSWLAKGNLASRVPSEGDLWEVLAEQFPAGIGPGNAAGQSLLKDRQISRLDMVALRAVFNHENRLRTLESRPQLTQVQFLALLKGLL